MTRGKRRRVPRRATRALWTMLTRLVALSFVLASGVASAYWTAGSEAGGNGASAAGAVNQGATPTASAAGHAVTVSWAATTLTNGQPVGGYTVKRYSGSTAQTLLTDCTGTITLTTCTENSVPSGTWTYSVTPVFATSWTGAESAKSSPVTVEVIALGTAGTYSVLAENSVISTGATNVSGDLGVSPDGLLSLGDPPATVGGTIHDGDAQAAQAQADLVNAYDDAAARTPSGDFAGDQIGEIFYAGVYHTAEAFALTGTMTLDGQGNPNAAFIFQIDAAMNLAAGGNVALINGAQASNVFWQVEGAVVTAASLSGTIMAEGAITLGASTHLTGRALSYDTVTLANNTVRFTTALPPGVTIDGGATAVTKDPTPTISGTTDAPAATTVTVGVGVQELTTTVQGDGTWSVTASALSAGPHDVVASVRDSTGDAGFATQALTVEINPAPVVLGTAGTYSVLAKTGVVSTGATNLNGDLGVHPGLLSSVTGFPPGIVGGAIHANDTPAEQAQADLVIAYNNVAARTPALPDFTGDQIDKTFHAGVYHTADAFALSGTMTLDGEDNPDAVFIFQIDGAMSPAAGANVTLMRGAQASNVFWQVEGAAGTASSLSGTIMAEGAITLGDGTQLTGRALSYGTVTLASNIVTLPMADLTGPTGGSVDAGGLAGAGSRYSTSTVLSLNLAKGTDPSGVAATGALLSRATATLTSAGTADGVCGTFGAYALVDGGTDPVSPKSDTVTDQACYTYRYVVADTLGNPTTYTSPAIKVDTTAPAAPALAFSAFTNMYWGGPGSTVIYYRSVAATGTFTTTAAATDTASGIASYAFPDLGTNWTSAPGVLGVNTYSWSGTPAAPGTKNVTATNHATGISPDSPFTLTADDTAPNVGTVTYLDGTTTGTSVSVDFTTGTDGGSGVGARLLQRASATLTGSTCGTFETFSAVVGGINPTSPLVDTVTPGLCYQYQYVTTDQVGNQGAPASSASVAKISASPVLTTTGSPLDYTENATQLLDSGITATDADSTNLTSATVTMTTNYVNGQDTLAFTDQLGITGTWTAATGVLALSGTTTVANYQAALRLITYSNNSDNPSTADRTVTFAANDGALSSNTAARTITLTAVNDAPVNGVPGAQTATTGVAKVFSSGNSNLISISDLDAGSLQVRLVSANGTTTLSGTSGLSFTVGDGTADTDMTFTGTVSNVNAALEGLGFTPTVAGLASLEVITSDLGSTGTGGTLTDSDTVSITVT